MRFRKKSLEVEAMEFDGSYGSAYDIVQTLKPVDGLFTYDRRLFIWHDCDIERHVEKGDWIIKDGDKFYPCSKQAFELLYEPAICSEEMPEEPATVTPSGTADLYCGGCGKPKVLCLGGTTGCNK